MCAMFWSLLAISYDAYRTVVKQTPLATNKAVQMAVMMWVINALAAGLLSLVSPLQLVDSGVYCFFAFASYYMACWFLPSIIICVVGMAYYYWNIFALAREVTNKASSIILRGSNGNDTTIDETARRSSIKLAQRLALFVIIFFLCWAMASAVILMKLADTYTAPWDGITGVFASLHNVLTPFMYGYLNRRLRLFQCFRAIRIHSTDGWRGSHQIQTRQEEMTSGLASPTTRTKAEGAEEVILPTLMITVQLEKDAVT